MISASRWAATWAILIFCLNLINCHETVSIDQNFWWERWAEAGSLWKIVFCLFLGLLTSCVFWFVSLNVRSHLCFRLFGIVVRFFFSVMFFWCLNWLCKCRQSNSRGNYEITSATIIERWFPEFGFFILILIKYWRQGLYIAISYVT